MTQQRRKKGSIPDPVRISWRVAQGHKDYIDELAVKAGISSAAVFDLLVASIKDESETWPTWLPKRADHEGKLPIE